MSDFRVNQIVRGHKAGTFVIVGFKLIGGEMNAILKEVHPDTFDRPQRGQIALPLSMIAPI